MGVSMGVRNPRDVEPGQRRGQKQAQPNQEPIPAEQGLESWRRSCERGLAARLAAIAGSHQRMHSRFAPSPRIRTDPDPASVRQIRWDRGI